MRQSRKKRSRSQQVMKEKNVVSVKDTDSKDVGDEEQRIISNLVEAFSFASIEEVQAAYKEANGDQSKAFDILTDSSTDSYEAYNASCSSSNRSLTSSDEFRVSSGGSSSSGDANGVDCREFRGSNKGKKVVAAAGTISNFLGKDYVSAKSRKEAVKDKGVDGGCGGRRKVDVNEAEQFLFSMLGDDCELGMAVVKDVLCNCEYDVEKALEILLDLSASPSEPCASEIYSNSSDYSRSMDFSDSFWQLSDMGSDSNSYCSESDGQDSIQFFNFTGRNYAEALISSDSSRKKLASSLKTNGNELPQQLLESLFNMPKSAEHDPSTMNWRNVVRQMESFAQKQVELGHSDSLPQHMITEAAAKGAEYQVFRGTAQQRWEKTRNCYQKAAAAYSNGEKNYATYMSEQGKLYSKMAREADEKASMEIFNTRNKGIENSLTIDLHGQHVKQAMRVVKLHLLFATYISSVQYIRVITGCGSRGLGKSIVKQSVINLLKNESVSWREENQGTVLIKLDGPREFSFLDSRSDSDTE